MTTSPPTSTAASALATVRHGQTGAQFVLGLIVLGSAVSPGLRSKSSPLVETKACGAASIGEAGIHERTTASSDARVTRHGNIVTLLVSGRTTGLPTPEGAWPRTPRDGIPRAAVCEQRVRVE